MQSSTQFNLEKAHALVVDGNAPALDILCGVLTGFGLRHILRASNGKEAVELLRSHPVDLIFTDSHMAEMDGYDLISWLRREAGDLARMTPAIIVSSHTPRTKVEKARDCGASYTIAKPISPSVVLDRILWIANGERHFIECETYVGPDRRWRNAGPPVEHPDGRRKDDKPAEIGEASTDNLSQAELDGMIKPQRLAG